MIHKVIIGTGCLLGILQSGIVNASLCTGVTNTTWTVVNPLRPPAAVTINDTTYTGCSTYGVTRISGTSFSGDYFTWGGQAQSSNIFFMSGSAIDENLSGLAQGLLTTLELSNPSWDIVNVTDNLSGWYVEGFDSNSISLIQQTNAASVFIGGTAMFNFGHIDVEFVPVPASIWLFGSGLLGLIGVARHRSN